MCSSSNVGKVFVQFFHVLVQTEHFGRLVATAMTASFERLFEELDDECIGAGAHTFNQVLGNQNKMFTR